TAAAVGQGSPTQGGFGRGLYRRGVHRGRVPRRRGRGSVLEFPDGDPGDRSRRGVRTTGRPAGAPPLDKGPATAPALCLAAGLRDGGSLSRGAKNLRRDGGSCGPALANRRGASAGSGR